MHSTLVVGIFYTNNRRDNGRIMDSLKDWATIGAIIFAGGGLWRTVKFLERAVEKMELILQGHENRLTILEVKKRRR